ncbi:helix-turn-helix transcriptional regulator, partial [Enterococcus hirae]
MFPEKIKELRLSKKMTQQEVADKLGITRPAYT